MQDNMSRGGESSPHAVYAIAFTVVAVVALIALLFVVFNRSQADDVSQSTAVTNAVPVIMSITTATTTGGIDISTFSVPENSTASLYVHGAAEDSNGCSSINTAASNWTMALFRANISGGIDCASAYNNCLQNSENTETTLTNCTGAGDLNLNYEAVFSNLKYYTDPTDLGSPYAATNWISYVKVDDGALNAVLTDTWEFGSTIALDVTSSINYGTLALAATSAEKTLIFTNTGNQRIDADQTASGDMVCNGTGSNNISVGQIHYGFVSGFVWSSGVAFAAGTTNFDMTLAYRTNDSTASTTNTYLRLVMPSTGVSGTCSNTITFTAKADA